MPVSHYLELSRLAIDSLDKRPPLADIERDKNRLQQQLKDLEAKENLLKLRELFSRLSRTLGTLEQRVAPGYTPDNLSNAIIQLTQSITQLESSI